MSALVLVVVGFIALTHSRSPAAFIVGQSRSLPAGVEAMPGDRGTVVDAEARLIRVYTSGSSTCPTVPQSAEVDGESEVVVHLVMQASPGGICSADIAFTTTTIRFPPEYAGSGDVTVTLQP